MTIGMVEVPGEGRLACATCSRCGRLGLYAPWPLWEEPVEHLRALGALVELAGAALPTTLDGRRLSAEAVSLWRGRWLCGPCEAL